MSTAAPTRRGILFLIGAFAITPIVGLAVIASHSHGSIHHVFGQVLIPAAIGTTLGALMIVMRRRLTRRLPRGPGRQPWIWLIFLGALIGTISGHLPLWLRSGSWGWIIGTLISLDVLLVNLWKRDPVFRARISKGLGSGRDEPA